MSVPFAGPFLAGEPRATALLNDGFRRVEAWREEARARSGQGVAPDLLARVQAPDSEAGRGNLAALGEPGTVAVVTGQQVGLFLGPLYTFYKACSAIAWARAVERETGARCVPIFWLQTEDHDFKEIAACAVPPDLRLALPPVESRGSVAHLAVPEEIAPLLARLADALAPLPDAPLVLELLRRAWTPGRPLGQAFAATLLSIFAEEGLLVLDPRCDAVARRSSEMYCTAIERAEEIDRALLQRGLDLERAGLREQVNVRRGSPLVFFHGGRPEDARRRLTVRGDGCLLDGGGEISRAALLRVAREEPLRLSSSALLRPIVQDALLPVVAYVGGPAELGYLAQTAPLYRLFKVRPSLAAPRARFRLIDARSAARLAALGLSPAEVEVPRDQLLSRLGSQRAPPSELARRFLGDLPALLTDSAAKHPGLARAARRTQLTVERAAARFAERHARLLAAQDATLLDRVDRLQATLFPGGAPQERVHSLPFYAARHGLGALKAAVLAAAQPGSGFSPATQDLRL
jgi:bacillithiol biosynthesis cysteine-adding enzyme BshC